MSLLVCQFLHHRIGACLASLSRLSKLESSMKWNLACLLSYIMHSTDTNLIIMESYLREALADLNSEGLTTTFGMFFLHDLNLNARPQESMLPEIQDDSQLDLAVSAFCPKIHRSINRPHGLEDCNMNNFPLGRNSTWSAVKRCL